MKDDDEIQSSGSPASPISNGRITVTVAAAPPPPTPPSQNTITLALPNQQSKGSGGGSGGGGREDCWSEGATSVLIDAWGERYLELSRGNLKQKHWKEVADIVSSREDYTKIPRTDIQCKNRIDTVKKKYKTEKAKISAGGGPSKWPFYDRLDQLIGPASKNPVSSAGVATTVNPPLQNQKVPLGIPVVNRSLIPYQAHHNHNHQQQQKGQKAQKVQFHKRPRTDSDSSGSERETSPTSSDSYRQGNYRRKSARVQKEVVNPNLGQMGKTEKGRNGSREKGWRNAVSKLTEAILKFGEAYEQAESSKLQQVVEMEKQRMKFAKDLELQRMQFFMKTQLEISQLKHGRRVVAAGNHHCSNNNNNNNNNNHSNSESSN
ncbi:trihelix transcription factor ASIL2-like [Cucurbita pepo subsp. pepo]|uniref:trihelix transcription factor ASIL2-like n=1 Tax=Cucurbita pepo subsp. pepo TaxID=3664 RepID=UPI000C9DA046|nr:trihelix transcription factor ASIL2-like [Cucurbita pepo subsp. pepo]